MTPRSPPHAQNVSFFADSIHPLRSPWKSGRREDNALGKVGTIGRRLWKGEVIDRTVCLLIKNSWRPGEVGFTRVPDREPSMNIQKREQDGVIIFDIEGEIKRSDITDVTLHQLVKEQLEGGKKHILLNFQKVDFIDSFGVGEILASYISTHNLGGKLKIARISKKLYLVFQITMLTKVLEIFDEEQRAIESFLKD